MKIFPAIDLRDGKAVRLFQGDYDQMTVYNDDPASVAREFRAKGAEYLHVVDLDGAKDGKLVNFATIRTIVEEGGMFVEVGGGIRDEERIRQYLDLGVGRVILGTAAVTNLPFLQDMVDKYGEKIAVGVDAKDGLVAINGWKEITQTRGLDFCAQLRGMGVNTVIYTDISRDGGLQGTNMEVYEELSGIEGLNIVASGGISFLSEIQALRGKVDAAILGKAIYTGALDLAEAIRLAR
ncbi:1-(5-phosphoribosyl)-5-[(5-phosphoribosylamino)methylideneamino]imidazole-4-carboxamide isomerase [Bacilliculturomica massiliensis]|uniref:1-(5-phosphoribosyl)-5-[(5- phosphoribosylamino)methylideneamino]imidazole-4- carboxamide isomerase n=1 Tax=Bacilliculturomica massiliensis TaxID=1917867 RepID=UPI001030AD11|nr:1-(5-phosphoribosyl)-5-[(5-phosphoribosylamino)methylideneamino]imidazole-4-carboxamide isomerase [Bacilliculturomica massiliensis]